MLYVSHDRYFINQTATRILDLKNETLVNYLGNYDYYLEKTEELTRIYAPASKAQAAAGPAKTPVSSSREDWEAKKRRAGQRAKASE